MSLYWDRKTYTAFKYRVGCKITPREKLTWKWYPTPGCNAHTKIVGTRRGNRLFEAFHKRPQKSYLVYWRSHQEEYNAMLAAMNKPPRTL